MSHHVVELHVVDFVGGTSLEPLINQVVFSVTYLQFLVVEDGSEPGVGDETALALILILEERLDQKSAVFNLSTNSLHQMQ